MPSKGVDLSGKTACITGGGQGLGRGEYRPRGAESRIADQEQSGKFLRMVLQKRYGAPEEIKGLALYLTASQSSFMTGQIIHLDGGSSAL